MDGRTLAERVGERVKVLRGRRTVPDLAKAVRTDRSHMWRIEQGHVMPKPDLLQRIADELKVTVSDLFAEPAVRRSARGAPRKPTHR